MSCPQTPPSKYLCLAVCGYRKPGMSEGAYRHHMTQISAPMTKDLMVKYCIKRWTVIHNTTATRELMNDLYDSQMANVADFDCFSQVVFESLDDHKRLKEDLWYKGRLFQDHEEFADNKRSKITFGWIEEYVRDGVAVDGLKDSRNKALSLELSQSQLFCVYPSEETWDDLQS